MSKLVMRSQSMASFQHDLLLGCTVKALARGGWVDRKDQPAEVVDGRL